MIDKDSLDKCEKNWVDIGVIGENGRSWNLRCSVRVLVVSEIADE